MNTPWNFQNFPVVLKQLPTKQKTDPRPKKTKTKNPQQQQQNNRIFPDSMAAGKPHKSEF